jgi:hypothetical protein
MTAVDGFDDLAQRLAIALRDRADATRAMPDVEAMRRVLEAAAAKRASAGARHSPRVLAAAAFSLVVLGGIGLVAGTANGDPAAIFVADESLVAEARGAPSSTTTTTAVPIVTVAPSTTVEPMRPTAPPPTIATPPSTTLLSVAAVSNDLQPAPTTTLPPPTTTLPPPTTLPAPAPTAPPPTTTKVPRTTTTTTVASPTTTAQSFAFTMTQKWKTSSASPPFEEFSGTAQPGATITITSSYGGGTTVVGPTGAWALRVEFPNAPLNTQFTGKVKTAQGQKTFTFNRTTV